MQDKTCACGTPSTIVWLGVGEFCSKCFKQEKIKRDGYTEKDLKIEEAFKEAEAKD